LELDATLSQVDGELEVQASTHADRRELGMTWSPLGILRAPSKLIVTRPPDPTSRQARLIFTTDRQFPRGDPATIGRLVTALDAEPSAGAFDGDVELWVAD